MGTDFTYQTIDPVNPNVKREVIIPHELGLRFYKHYPVRYLNFLAAKKVLDDPKRIFSRIRIITDGGWCYVGKPDVWYVTEESVVPFPSDLVYAVYMNDRMFVQGHRAEIADQEDPLSPKNWKTRFGGLKWKSIS